MFNYLTVAWAALIRFAQPDVDAVIRIFIKAQKKLQVVIDRELQQTERETQAIEDAYAAVAKLMSSLDERNKVIDRAYRIIHNLDGLVA